MKELLKRLLKEETGQAMLEYSILTAFVSLWIFLAFNELKCRGFNVYFKYFSNVLKSTGP